MKKTKDKNEEIEMKQENTDNLTSQNEEQTPQPENSAVEEVVADKNKAETAESQQQQSDTPNFEVQVAEWKDKYIRLSAEFDNYRKRTLKEKIELTKYAGEEILKNLLPIVDDFERGLKTIDQAKDLDAVKEGIYLIYNKFGDFLKQKGLKEIEALNLDFNTDFHDAITKIPVQDKAMSGKVVDVVQKGYLLDKIIRHSKVVVGE